MKTLQFLISVIRLRSFSRARWVQAYNNFKTSHGK